MLFVQRIIAKVFSRFFRNLMQCSTCYQLCNSQRLIFSQCTYYKDPVKVIRNTLFLTITDNIFLYFTFSGMLAVAQELKLQSLVSREVQVIQKNVSYIKCCPVSEQSTHIKFFFITPIVYATICNNTRLIAMATNIFKNIFISTLSFTSSINC